MADMLVKLYDLPDPAPHLARLREQGINIRHARTYEMSPVIDWVREVFAQNWADEAAACFARHPVSCLIAVHDGALLGFACYEATCRNYLGPMGVSDSARGRGIGAALLLAALRGLADLGYAYAVIGGVGPRDFYTRTCGAIEIPDSTPGIYRDRLRPR